ADAHGWPHAIVGYADFTAPDVRPQLDRLAGFPLMRGIRQQLHWHENPLYRFAARPDLSEDPTVQRNIAHLAAYGWCFDLQVFAPQMEGAAALAEACPEVTFILQHAGMLEDLTETGRAAWLQGMKRLARAKNVMVKLSGLGTFLHRNDPAHIADIVATSVKLFSPKRCMFGSNFPIEKIWTSYAALFGAFQTATAELSAPARRAIFNDTAARVYSI
ncbi:MAG: amidohydrolase family protein, partial [Pseudomonadota bacterium]